MWKRVLFNNARLLPRVTARSSTTSFSTLKNRCTANHSTVRISQRKPFAFPVRFASSDAKAAVLKYDGQVISAMDGVAVIAFGAKELDNVHIGERVFFFKPKGSAETIVGGSGPAPTASVQDADEGIQRATGLVMNISETEVTAVIVEDVNNIVTQGVYVSLGKELPSINVGFELLSVVTDSTGTHAFVPSEVAKTIAKSTQPEDEASEFAALLRSVIPKSQISELSKLRENPTELHKKLKEVLKSALGASITDDDVNSAAEFLFVPSEFEFPPVSTQPFKRNPVAERKIQERFYRTILTPEEYSDLSKSARELPEEEFSAKLVDVIENAVSTRLSDEKLFTFASLLSDGPIVDAELVQELGELKPLFESDRPVTEEEFYGVLELVSER